MELKITTRQLEILQHALGVDEFARTPKGFTPFTRNYFCAGAADEPDCRRLVELGLMQEHRRTDLFPYFNCSVTKDGVAAMKELSPKPPVLTRSQQRYREWFDADNDQTFFEWLKDQSRRTESIR